MIDFLHTLFGRALEENPGLLIQLVDIHAGRVVVQWFDTVEKASTWVGTQKHRQIYCAVALSRQNLGPHRRASAEEAECLTALWADIDIADGGHQKKNLPSTEEEAMSLLPAEFPPSIVIHSGGGLQCWWLFREPEVFVGDPEGRGWAQTLSERWQRWLRYGFERHGYTIDSTYDLARILRVPGTSNTKLPGQPRPVRLLRADPGRTYNPEEIDDHLDVLGIPASLPKLDDAKIDGSLTYRDDATVDPAIIEALCEADLKFRETWARNRCDWHDRSQSAYDMSIASIACAAGLPDQTVVNAMIEHRRRGGAKPKLRADYFRRTLVRAKRECTPITITLPAAAVQPPADQPPLPADSVYVDEQVQRGAACERMSDIVGFRIIRIVQIMGDPIRYHIDTDRGLIVMGEEILKQDAFNTTLSQRYKIWPKGPKKKDWPVFRQLILDALIEKSGGDESDAIGRARGMVEQYLETNAIVTEEEGRAGDILLPVLVDDAITVSSEHMRDWVVRRRAERVTVNDVVEHLNRLGCTNVRPVFGGKKRSRWRLPPEQFDPTTYTVKERKERTK